MSEPTLPDKILALHGALAGVPHAFGGAIALGYHAEPRSTIDIDLNVFVPGTRAGEVLAPLVALGIRDDPAVRELDARALIERDGQARLWWGRTPVDLFFAYDPFHDVARDAAIEVPFADATIPVLSATHLTVCKAVFDRPRDWVDIEAILTQGTPVDVAEVLRWVGRIAGDEDPRYDRIANLLSTR